jgi:serine protease Do
MTKANRSVAALLVTGGIVLGILFTSGLEWTASGDSQPRALNGSQAEVPPELQAMESFNQAFVTVAAIARPIVVTITSEKVMRPSSGGMPEGHPFREYFGDDFFERFWGGPPGGEGFRSQALGSGVIISDDGYLLTNNHVVADAEEITVILADDREFEAEVVGTDPESDIALLHIDADDLPMPRFGDSDDLRVGEWVVASGSPFSRNLAETVTAGIVSATGRTSVGIVDFEDFIQTDAAINPGNSGGALMNMRGELIGINTAIATRTRGSQGVGFAIPINMARAVMDDLLNEGRVIRGWLGVVIQTVDDDLAAGFDLPAKTGVLINDLTEDGPADRAGVERGDIILEFEGTPVRDADHLQILVAAVSPGTKVELEVLRDGREKRIRVKLGERPVNPREAFARQSDEGERQNLASRLGLDIEPLTARVARELGYDDVDEGLVVSDVRRGSVAATKNIREGDLILEVNRQEPDSIEEIDEILADVEEGDAVLLLLRRGQTTFYTAVKMPPADN